MATPSSSIVPEQAPHPAAASASTITTPAPPVIPEFKVYRPPINVNAPPPPALSEDWFTPTASDLQAAQATLSARTNALVNAPLQLKSAREKADKAKRDRWPETRIRIKFPDQTQLERKFPTTDKIRSVYAFVRGCLTDEGKAVKFILYQSPPKRDLKVSDPSVRDQTLYDLHLAPSSILLLRFEDERMNHDRSPAPLLPEILEKAIDLPMPAAPAGPSEPAPIPAPSTSQAPVQKSASNEAKEKKIAKFLKLGKK